MTCECENKKDRLVHLQSQLLNIPSKMEKNLAEHFELDTQKQRLNKEIRALEGSTKFSVSNEKDADGKPLYKNQEQRDHAVFNELGVSKVYSELQDSLEIINKGLFSFETKLEVLKYEFRASVKLVELENIMG